MLLGKLLGRRHEPWWWRFERILLSRGLNWCSLKRDLGERIELLYNPVEGLRRRLTNMFFRRLMVLLIWLTVTTFS